MFIDLAKRLGPPLVLACALASTAPALSSSYVQTQARPFSPTAGGGQPFLSVFVPKGAWRVSAQFQYIEPAFGNVVSCMINNKSTYSWYNNNQGVQSVYTDQDVVASTSGTVVNFTCWVRDIDPLAIISNGILVVSPMPTPIVTVR